MIEEQGELLRWWPAVRWHCPCGQELYETRALPDILSTGRTCPGCQRRYLVYWQPTRVLLLWEKT